MSTSRWRSSTGDWCKLAGWRGVSLPDSESALGPLGMSGDLWGKLLASSPLWHHRGTGDRERGRERELEALQNKTAEESPRLLCQLIYVALWLGVATEPDTCWSPHDWTHLWTNWTLRGYLDTDDIQHTRMHKRDLHTRIPIGSHTTCMHTPTHTYIDCHTVTVRVMDQCRLKLSWILHGVWSRKRIIIERWRSFRLLGKSSFLSFFFFFLAACRAAVVSGWWSVVLGHLGISLFCVRGSNRDWDRQPNRNLIKLRHKQTLWIQTLHREEACHAPLSNQNAPSNAGTPEVFALQIRTWVTEICKIMFRAMVKCGTFRRLNNAFLD